MSDQVFVQAMLDQLERELSCEGASLYLPSLLGSLDPLELHSLPLGNAPAGGRSPEPLELRDLEVVGLSRQTVSSLLAGGANGRTITVETRMTGELKRDILVLAASGLRFRLVTQELNVTLDLEGSNQGDALTERIATSFLEAVDQRLARPEGLAALGSG